MLTHVADIAGKNMVSLRRLVDYTNEYLGVNQFKDYCPNGLQVEGRTEVNCLLTGVTASLAFIERAIDEGADALLVHHGYFWRGESSEVVGMKKKRLAALLRADVSLLAYHLPLDAHPVVGNNACLAGLLDVRLEGNINDSGVGNYGTLSPALSPDELSNRIETALGRAPLRVGKGPASIEKVGWCTGGAQGYIEDATALGLDAYISGEISEQTMHVADECGLHYFAAGHHATERYGVQALGEHLREVFGLDHRYIEINNPA